jgi:small nuclear ribonucleoprotein (snRNP)-like protein
MSKKLDYSNIEKVLLDRTVIVGLKGGTNLTGDIRHIDDTTIVLVTEPTSTLDIETKIVHTVINAANVDFIQFKTDRKKE